MTAQPVQSPHDQSATFVELFFDLVFVFCVTQVVYVLAHALNPSGLLESFLAFWLVWWAWTQFTWALNAADTTHPWVEFWTLVATGVAFFMAVAIPGAFHGGGLVFAVPYVLVRTIGLGVYLWVAGPTEQRSAVVEFAAWSVLGLIAVLVGGALGGEAQFWVWGLAIGLDVLAAARGARSEEWGLHPEHFAERHGLIVIIALGEGLIVAGAAVTQSDWTTALLGAAAVSVTLTCALWWTYFPVTKPALEHALEASTGSAQARMARDAFSLLHFPLICGVIALAVVIEEALAHPADPLELPVRIALAAGLALFLGATGAARWRADGTVPWLRTIAGAAAAVAVVLAAGLPPLGVLGIGLIPVLAVAVFQGRGPAAQTPGAPAV